jgi:hypothetical protein
MTEPKNRAARRHPEKVVPPDRPQSAEHDLVKNQAQDDLSVRAKSTGHGKKTADKWNQ